MATVNSPSISPRADTPVERSGQRIHGDLLLYLTIGLLTLGAWRFCRLGLFNSGDDVGYWLGIAGGTMMLLLFSYPLRKYLRFMHRWGKVKWWFLVHMILGVCGPMLILLHTTFHLASVNASVALFSMIIVAGSGVAGRFLYLRVHRGLQGQRNNLRDLQQRAGLAEGEVRSRFRFAPKVEQQLLSFQSTALAGGTEWSTLLKRVFVLPLRQRLAYRACTRELDAQLRAIGRAHGWSRGKLRRRKREAGALARDYLFSIVRVAQFAAYERLFALWHVLHVPFVYLLLLTAFFHVFAVHAY